MNIEEDIWKLRNQINEDKEFFWSHPEKGLKEIETSNYIKKRLINMGYKAIDDKIYNTGIIATLYGKENGPCILFRTDMDAVCMDNTGRLKHTCGHDAHMTIMLALAKLLIDNKDKINGTVKLLFEPDEEENGGAKPMIQNGALSNPKVDKAFAIHMWSEFEEDTIAIKDGPIMASTDPFNITIYGKSGHAAIPQSCVNPIYIANKIIEEINIMEKNINNTNKMLVLGITSIIAGNNNNVIPENAYLKGICRTYDNNLRCDIKEKLKDLIERVATSMNGKAHIEFISEYPATINSYEEAKTIEELSKKIVKNVVTDYKTMCSEDFSYFLNEVSGALIFVGCKKNQYYPQHNENFQVGENPMLIGVQIFYEIVKKYLYKNF